jgi:phosphonate degradation associated HDIG domain protein
MHHDALHLDDVAALYRRRGHLAYDGEGITQLQHGWQCGRLAAQAGATPALQLAAWLHDLGHLLTDLDGTPTLRGVDDGHERSGARVLARLWGPAVSEPVALHVQAKRCLVTSQPGYFERLSPDSVRSLALQGGPMTAEAAAAFQSGPFARDALRLRVWDDIGKDNGLNFSSADAALAELQALMAMVAGSR